MWWSRRRPAQTLTLFVFPQKFFLYNQYFSTFENSLYINYNVVIEMLNSITRLCYDYFLLWILQEIKNLEH